MRTKGSVGYTLVDLAMLNKLLKPTAQVMVTKKFAEALKTLSVTKLDIDNSEKEEDTEEVIEVQKF
jgi:hypothetical protein